MTSWRKLRPIAAVLVVAGIILAAGQFAKSYFLSQVRRRVEASFLYDELRMSFFPPVLVLKNVRTKPPSSVFSARAVAVQISYFSLLKRDKPLTLVMDGPVLSLDEDVWRSSGKTRKPLFPLPFTIERGLVKDGRIVIKSKDLALDLRQFKAVLKQRGSSFSCRGDWEDALLKVVASGRELAGAGSVSLYGEGDEIILKRLTLAGTELSLNAKGRIVGVTDPRLHLKVFVRLPMDVPARIIGLPFVWSGRVEAKGDLIRDAKGLFFRTTLASRDIILNRVPLGRVSGTLNVGPGLNGRVELDILSRHSHAEFAAIDFEGSRVRGTVRNFGLDPIMSGFNIPWPVQSPFWGSFSASSERVTADGEFRDEIKKPSGSRFHFNGPVSLTWDGKETLLLSSPEIRSSFAVVKAKGRLNVLKDCDFEIGGEVLDVRQARRFLSLVLRQAWTFPEIRGRGKARVRITGRSALPRVDIEADLAPGSFDKFNARSVTGTVQVVDNRLQGRFNVKDPQFEGEVSVDAAAEKYSARLRADRAKVEMVLAGLEIPLPLKGEAKGTFDISQKTGDLDVTAEGDFSAAALAFLDRKLTGVSGRLGWANGTLTLKGLRFDIFRGEVQGDAKLGILDHGFDLDIKGRRIDLAAFAPKLQGRLRFDCKGRGTFGTETAPGTFALEDALLGPFPKTNAGGGLEVDYDFSGNVLNLKLKGNIEPGANDFEAACRIPFDQRPPAVNLKGSFSNLELLVPFKGVQGKVNYLGEVRAEKGSAQVRGVVDFQGPVFPIPFFAHAFNDYSGLVFVENERLIVRSLRGTLGGGTVQGSGEVKLGEGGVAAIDLKAEARDMLVSPFERTRGLADGSIRLVKNPVQFLLEGTFDVKRLSWRRDVFEKVSFSTAEELEPRPPGFFDDLNLNLRFRTAGDAWLDNSLGRVNGRFDLTVTGSVRSPILLGDIEALDGTVNFQDRTFKVLKGRVSFLNPLSVEPTIDIKGETYVKDYRVTVSVAGSMDRLKTEFSSSPPLPPEDVLALLALGEAFRRTYSYDRSTQQSTASLLSFQLAEKAKLGTGKLFVIDRFRIDPFILGTSAEMTARLSVGKKITKNLFILYSTNLTTQRDEIVRIEWELSNEFSLVGIRDELGRVSLDLKVRRRF